MEEYQYPDKATGPSLSGIHDDVAISEMTDKNISYCRWDEDTELLRVYWDDALSGEDESILDQIVVDNS